MSLFLQSSIAILASILMLILVLRPTRSKQKRREHRQALVIATIEFQKSQCYFAGATQIAALVFSSRQSKMLLNIQGYLTEAPDLVDDGFLYPMATCGILPVTFTLALIARYGRQSWYLTLLSLSIFVLSTVTLATSTKFWYDLNREAFFKIIHSQNLRSYTPNTFTGIYDDSLEPLAGACGNVHPLDLAVLLCGSTELYSKKVYYPMIIGIGICFIWAHCLIWMLYFLLKQGLSSESMQPRAARLRSAWRSCAPGFLLSQRLLKATTWHRFWHGVLAITWSICFSFQFHMYSLVFSESAVDTTWSFGQVVAIIVWLPCLVEYLNLEISKCFPMYIFYAILINGTDGISAGSIYKYPAPLTVVAHNHTP